jgi:hypothetical protein
VSLLLKVVIFLGFLLVYVAWVVISYLLNNRLQKDLIRGNAFLASELNLLSSSLGLFAFIWILSGFFSIQLVGLFLLLAHVGFLITGVLWAFLGSPLVAWGPRAIWAGSEFGVKQSAVMIVLLGVSVIVLIGYPVAAGIIFFGGVISSEQATLSVFRLTLVGMVLSGLTIMLPLLVGVLQSKNLDEDTRTRLFITQGGNMASYALYLSLILWSFGRITAKGFQLKIGTIPLTISPILLIILAAFFLFAFLLPYLAGSQQAKRWRSQLLRKQQAWLDELLDVLEFPTPNLYVPKLEQLQAKVEGGAKAFVGDDSMLILAEEFDQVKTLDEVDPQSHSMFLAYKKSRQLDPRMRHLDFLVELQEEVRESIAQLSDLADDAQLTKKASGYADAYRARRDVIDKAIEAQKKAKPPVWAALAFLLSPVLGQVLSEFGKSIWTVFSQALGS